MTMKLLILVTMLSFLFASCEKVSEIPTTTDKDGTVRKLEKFEPENGKCLLIVGQDLGAVGGLPMYSDGYCDTFPTPAGVTGYITLVQGSPGGISGMYAIKNWGSGDCSLNQYIGVDRFSNCIIAIGMHIVGQETAYVNGSMDKSLIKLADWLKSIAPRPVFLRVGYEFDGFDWNHYKPETYVPAFKYIHDKLDAEGVTNVAYTWQSKGYGCSLNKLEEFYPGDDYVDWCAYSYFDQSDTKMIDFARKHKKPVFIAESTPTMQDGKWNYYDCYLTNEEQAKWLWKDWFEVLMKIIKDNDDIVKAWHYINVDWYTQSMWKTNITFQKVDSRIQASPYVKEKWTAAVVENDAFIQSSTLKWNELPR